MNIVVDLTWVRHGKVGGTESFILNLLNGIKKCHSDDKRFTLVCTLDNYEVFEKYTDGDYIQMYKANIKSANKIRRVVWQNLCLSKVLKRYKADICFEPVYGKPTYHGKTKFVTVIHDLQALHFPFYFNKLRVMWMKRGWKKAVKSSDKIIAISNFVRDDVIDTYHIDPNKIDTIYNPISINYSIDEKSDVLERLKISDKGYFYTVSSLYYHKNLKSLILMMAKLKEKRSNHFYPLVISGIKGIGNNELFQVIKDNHLEDDVIFTSFISNEERNYLYKHAYAFLFPSIFEGFGMPPIEATAFSTPVLTTKCASLYEVTLGLLNYVEDPFSIDEWANKVEGELHKVSKEDTKKLLDRYDEISIAKQYIKMFENASNNK